MFCYNCGKQLPQDAIYCPSCGTQVGVSVSSSNQESVSEAVIQDNIHVEETVTPIVNQDVNVATTSESVNSKTTAQDTVVEEHKDLNGATKPVDKRDNAPFAVSSLIWAIVAHQCSAIPILGMVFSIIALCKSARGRRIVASNPQNYRLVPMLKVSYILSIADIVLSAIKPILLIVYWHSIKDLFWDFGFGNMLTGFV